MSTVVVSGNGVGTQLQELLCADYIQPGVKAGYDLCKQIYVYHPLGAKMAEAPIRMAQSQTREISIQKGPEERIKDAFLAQWKKDGCDNHIFNTARIARIYGISSLIAMPVDAKPMDPLDFDKLWEQELVFNVADPLNTAGSMVLNQNPNSPEFQKVNVLRINGQEYQRNRCCVMLNEDPLYIEYSSSAFGFSGRSVYQRALYPLKSFINTMIADDMVARKVGVIVTKLKSIGSTITQMMVAVTGFKRNVVKEAQTDNVISVGADDSVESLDLTGIPGALEPSRKNILENIAVAAGMPAQLLNSETFAEGFGEGTEDAKKVAAYIDEVRRELGPIYDFMDQIVMARAWNPEFYKTIQAEFPDEYGSVKFEAAFLEWQNSFTAKWPSLLTEPDSEKVRVDDVKARLMIAVVEVLLPVADEVNKAATYQWFMDNLNEMDLMFGHHLELDIDALAKFKPPEQTGADGKPVKVEGGAFGDSAPRRKHSQDQLQLALDGLNTVIAERQSRLKGPSANAVAA